MEVSLRFWIKFQINCRSSQQESVLNHKVGQIVVPQLQEGILVVFMRFQPERISERIVEQIVRCSSSRRIEQFIAT